MFGCSGVLVGRGVSGKGQLMSMIDDWRLVLAEARMVAQVAPKMRCRQPLGSLILGSHETSFQQVMLRTCVYLRAPVLATRLGWFRPGDAHS